MPDLTADQYESIHLPERIVLPGHSRAVEPAVWGKTLQVLPHAMRLSVIHAVEAGAHVVIMRPGADDGYVSIDRDPQDDPHLVDGPGLCLTREGERIRVEYAPRQWSDATIRTMATDTTVTFVVGMLIGWGLTE